MANGTNKPGYMSSFMSFIENQDSGDKPSTTTGDPGENQYDQDSQDDVGQEESNAATSEITSTDPDPTVQNTEVSANTDSSEKPSGTDGENTNSSESTTNSDAGETPASGRRNVARRGRRRSSGMSGGMSPGSGEPDGYGDSDPDFHLSDSDDDPDFNPINRKQAAVGSDEEDFKPRRGRGRGRGFGGVRGRGVGRGSGGVKRALDTSGSKNDSVSDKLTSPSSTVNPPKRRGRPPLYPQTSPSSTVPSSDDNTVSSTDDKNPPSKLSSAYNYAVARTQRQNQTIRLPEGPQLTAEQLEMVESQFKCEVLGVAEEELSDIAWRHNQFRNPAASQEAPGGLHAPVFARKSGEPSRVPSRDALAAPRGSPQPRRPQHADGTSRE
ncbi:hypothetical protein C7M84_000519 [Penaeus vannamei]|uniref:Uncharacterized protein n=1 Tax=Penaeus vannamei TaxID=6689 RepID=A0A423TWB2_PENVA|nr:hypothetical protein C7M84_000519 [Penaeus vannamei]